MASSSSDRYRLSSPLSPGSFEAIRAQLAQKGLRYEKVLEDSLYVPDCRSALPSVPTARGLYDELFIDRKDLASNANIVHSEEAWIAQYSARNPLAWSLFHLVRALQPGSNHIRARSNSKMANGAGDGHDTVRASTGRPKATEDMVHSSDLVPGSFIFAAWFGQPRTMDIVQVVTAPATSCTESASTGWEEGSVVKVVKTLLLGDGNLFIMGPVTGAKYRCSFPGHKSDGTLAIRIVVRAVRTPKNYSDAVIAKIRSDAVTAKMRFDRGLDVMLKAIEEKGQFCCTHEDKFRVVIRPVEGKFDVTIVSKATITSAMYPCLLSAAIAADVMFSAAIAADEKIKESTLQNEASPLTHVAKVEATRSSLSSTMKEKDKEKDTRKRTINELFDEFDEHKKTKPPGATKKSRRMVVVRTEEEAHLEDMKRHQRRQEAGRKAAVTRKLHMQASLAAARALEALKAHEV